MSEFTDESKEPLTAKFNTAYEKGLSFKEKANELFKNGEHKKAKSKYGLALAHITGLKNSNRTRTGYEGFAHSEDEAKFTNEQETNLVALELTIYTNITMCCLKLEEFSDAVRYSEKAIRVDSNSWKAYLRRGQAYIGLENASKAKEALNQAEKLTQDEKNLALIKNEKRKAKQITKKDDKESSNMWKGKKMFA